MADELHKGDHVSWQSHGTTTEGTVQRLKQDMITQAIKAYYMP